ncbi:putative glycolipid-binding domain-containing protein [Chryseobacterium sp.]|uniref:putative glycolipid-binding domain-containing protein n=1 Tax=Chryseobacterium sp. TaxID=1871047 RepID=UPI0025C45447|nr:putative glycolipid-binding domain-containing protein [Chryseobacterium sp.]MBV8328735.1 putative glycolipid-binding domain-containing protein [Chryseobacterium sp.]
MKTLIWKGICYESLEYFNIRENQTGYTATSKIIGCYENKIYHVNYTISIDKSWNILEFTIESEINTKKNLIRGRKIQNEWKINDTINTHLKGFTFIDISLTPFTNTLPVNHLQLPENGSQEIEAIYIDILNNQIKPAGQRYTRTSVNTYLYENIRTDFKADITVNESGLIENYPQLFKKIAEYD